MNLDDFKNDILPLKDNVYRIALRFLRNREDSEDACQDIFIKLWEKRSCLKKYSSVKAFVFTVAKNHCLDKLRTKKYQTIELCEENISDMNKNPEKELIQTESRTIVERLINSLPENLRLVIYLRDIEACSTDEVAEILGLTNINVRVNLSRARKKLRELLLKNKLMRYE